MPIDDAYDDRNLLLAALGQVEPQMVYFYCHGGVDDDIPFLEVGGENSVPITPQSVQTRLYWPRSRPLVFLNGCRTTALTPGHAHQFVSAFTGEPRAAGVIGTEVTIVEDLAGTFARALFEELRPGGDGRSQSVGEAIRRTRLRLLAEANPLGLVYSPFIQPDVRMVSEAA